MKILRSIILELLLLVAMCLCGTIVMKMMDFVLKLSYENAWSIGFKVGFVAWIVILALQIFSKKEESKNRVLEQDGPEAVER